MTWTVQTTDSGSAALITTALRLVKERERVKHGDSGRSDVSHEKDRTLCRI